MRGLLLRLSSLDADAESAVRVIGFFDALLTGKADLNTLLKSTAALAECPVGIRAAGRGLVLRANPDGTIDLSGPPPDAALRETGTPDTIFWLARDGTSLPLDDIVLERFALAGALLLDRTISSLPAVDDPALIELVISTAAGPAERSRALHLLGLPPIGHLRVAVITPAPATAPSSASPAAQWPNWRVAKIGEFVVALVPAELDLEVGDGSLMGIGPAVEGIRASESWRAARVALRLTSAEEPAVWAERLGGLLVLAERLRPEDIGNSPDVQALDRISGEPAGDDLLRILRAYTSTDSVRKAAALVFRHHSTVAYHLQHASAVLGFELDNPTGRFRLGLALVMRSLR